MCWLLHALPLVMLLSLNAIPGNSSSVNPCCYFPCQHKGVCVRVGTAGYECDCTRTGYYGTNCSVLRANLIPSPPTYNSDYGYISWEAYANVSYFTRVLPPVPTDCPTPMGTKGLLQLPDSRLVAERFFLRRTFHPDPQGTNLMFAFFAQHFTHQFFKTSGKMGHGFTRALGHGDFKFYIVHAWEGGKACPRAVLELLRKEEEDEINLEGGSPEYFLQVDLGHIYGDNLERQHKLRLFRDGKLKYQILKGEVYPPTVTEAPVHMIYPKHVLPGDQLAVGQEVFGLLPGLMIGYYLQLKFDPELLFGVQFQYRNRIAVEFNQLYHWHPLMPDSFRIQNKEYNYDQFIYNTTMLTDYGVEALVEAFSKQRAGQIGGVANINENLLKVAIGVIEESRLLRLQSFNEYRKRFNMKPYTSFLELTGDEKTAAELEELYGDIDALEFYPGLLVEKAHPNSIFGESMVEIGAPFSLKGLFGNPICSPEYWKPSTFGGATGFELVNTASLQKLVCLNVKKCPYVAFRVPNSSGEEPMEATSGSWKKEPSTEL
ncbi:hypothetical protein JD844_005063 [Phrynosoma platyrhinos]|uniref:Prostaglandin G/H synthase 1 n=1 Tax=Phrynosoma platyrhinos TaxID=52577 RepID=A0ABQ7SE51_PHRPL|nr:hypothetical protein JD844_005063 [Phrynosoma platyrhinos]